MEPINRSPDPDVELSRRLKALELGQGGRAARQELLKFLEDNKVSAPEQVVRFGSELVEQYGSGLGNDKYEVMEKVFVAALECGESKTARAMLKGLQAKFEVAKGGTPSLRLRRLQALALEHEGKFDSARHFYEEILKIDQVNQFALRRIVAIEKAQKNTAGAVKALNKYLELFPGDSEGWAELAEMYISVGRYNFARFCCEELILIQPQNYLYSLLYADVLYSMGSAQAKGTGIKDPLERAEKYYMQALELKPDDLRALYGLALCSRRRAAQSNSSKRSGAAIKQYKWAVGQIVGTYASEGKATRDKMVGLVKDAFMPKKSAPSTGS